MRGEELSSESLARYRGFNDRVGVAHSRGNLGFAALCQGNYDQTREHLTEALILFQDLGNKRGIAYSLTNLGIMETDQGKHEQGKQRFNESLRLYRSLGDKAGIAYDLDGLAVVAGGRGEREQAARLFGMAAALREGIHAPLSKADQLIHDRLWNRARSSTIHSQSDEAVWDAAWSGGHSMSLGQIIIEVDEKCAR